MLPTHSRLFSIAKPIFAFQASRTGLLEWEKKEEKKNLFLRALIHTRAIFLDTRGTKKKGNARGTGMACGGQRGDFDQPPSKSLSSDALSW